MQPATQAACLLCWLCAARARISLRFYLFRLISLSFSLFSLSVEAKARETTPLPPPPKLELSSRSSASSTKPTLQIAVPPLPAPPHGSQSSSSTLASKIDADFQWRPKRAPFCPLFDFSPLVYWPLPSLSEILPSPCSRTRDCRAIRRGRT